MSNSEAEEYSIERFAGGNRDELVGGQLRSSGSRGMG